MPESRGRGLYLNVIYWPYVKNELPSGGHSRGRSSARDAARVATRMEECRGLAAESQASSRKARSNRPERVAPRLARMTIDSNIVIAYLTGDKAVIAALSQWKETGLPLFLPAIVEAEVLSFPKLTEKELATMETFLGENFLSIPFDSAIARIAASIRRSTKVRLPDAAIAATALFTASPLVTRNVRDFRKVKGLTLISL